MRRTWTLLVSAWIVAAAPAARAQDLPVVAAGPPGQMSGTIRDERGQGIGGAMVIALGPTTVSARTDTTGRFTLPLPPGEYVIRATREGFISTYREVVRVPHRSVFERHIQLNRRGGAVPPPPRDAASDPENAPNHAHDEAAWRLRRLPPTVLRDRGSGEGTTNDNSAEPPRVSLLDWARQESRRAAGYLAGLDFTGHVNYFAAGSIARDGESTADASPAGVADLAIGAPPQDLDRHRSMQLFILRRIDDRQPTLPELALKPKPGELRNPLVRDGG